MAVDNGGFESQSISLDDLLGDADEALKSALSKARDLRNGGETSASMNLLLDLANMYPEAKAVFVLLGDLYWKQDDLAHARSCFQKATEIDPQLEIASLALYHTLWSLDFKEDALEEMKRFLQCSHSSEYNRLLQEYRGAMDEEDGKTNP